MLVTKIQHPKIFKLKKKKKKKTPASLKDEILISARAFSMNQSGCRQYTLREGVAYQCQSHALHVTACFNYSIAEV